MASMAADQERCAMRGPKSRFLLLALVLAAVAAGCDLFDDNGSSTNGGSLNVYLQDAPGNVTELWVKLDAITLYPDPSSPGVGVVADGQPASIDLIATAGGSPTQAATFALDDGSYQCISGTLALDHFVADDGQGGQATCTTVNGMSSIDIPKVCLPAPFLMVDGGAVSVLVDLPVVSGSCDPATGDGTLAFSSPSASLM
ncbi:MAG: DUF4382 domain-containing protein [Acidobacteria bacterium]|nr:MAG: DUF4382 domain-containing protein [Acidobacteriota bacterium]